MTQCSARSNRSVPNQEQGPPPRTVPGDPVPHPGDGPAPSQIFVDGSGRRARVTRRAGALVATVSALYVATVATGLAQTGVGPLPGIPATGNGLIAGFPSSAGVVPGLLAMGAHPTPRPVHTLGAAIRPVSTHHTATVTSAVNSGRPDRTASSAPSKTHSTKNTPRPSVDEPKRS